MEEAGVLRQVVDIPRIVSLLFDVSFLLLTYARGRSDGVKVREVVISNFINA